VPIVLPTPPRRVEKKCGLLGTVLNACMLVSALALTFMVLVQEHRFINGQPGPFADALTKIMQQETADTTGESQVIPPAN
jgi:hypothetical protein